MVLGSQDLIYLYIFNGIIWAFTVLAEHDSCNKDKEQNSHMEESFLFGSLEEEKCVPVDVIRYAMQVLDLKSTIWMLLLKT